MNKCICALVDLFVEALKMFLAKRQPINIKLAWLHSFFFQMLLEVVKDDS